MHATFVTSGHSVTSAYLNARAAFSDSERPAGTHMRLCMGPTCVHPARGLGICVFQIAGRLYEKTLQNPVTCTTAQYLDACGWLTANSFEANNGLALIRYFGQNLHPVSCWGSELHRNGRCLLAAETPAPAAVLQACGPAPFLGQVPS